MLETLYGSSHFLPEAAVGRLAEVIPMGPIRLLFLAALVMFAGIHAVASGQPSASDVDAAGQTYAECLQDCFEDYTLALAECDDECKKCVTSWWLICVVSVTDETCLNKCIKDAGKEHDACKAKCKPDTE